MARYFLDTSALAKLYVQEAGTDVVLDLADNPNNSLILLSVARVELHSAVRRRQRDGSLSSGNAQAILYEFEGHWQSSFVIQPVGDALLSVAVDLLSRRPLRAYDALQLAGGAMVIGSTFVCSDRELVQAARDEGLSVIDPTS